jgi:glycosyltransferase involved in cell wall biosynthesis
MKLAFLYSFEQSSWKSCQTITKNLLTTYKSIDSSNKLQHFNLNDHTSTFEMLKNAKEIVDSLPDVVVVLDHKPHPHKMLHILHEVYAEKKIKKLPQIIIHVFGDFTLYSKDWLAIEKKLKNFQVKLVCASDSQTDLVGKFLKNKKSGLYKCPFPVDAKDFSFDQDLRDKYRKMLGLGSNQTLYIYTGRLSMQKKILELMTDFAAYLKISKDDAYLFFAGEFDDLGNPFKGIYSKEGAYFQTYSKMHASLEENVKNRIRYIGNMSSLELRSLYSSADAFVSMSVHNDEDYGMSPAEALATGLPVILTAWAGYKSFKLKNNECHLIDTSIGDNHIIYDKGQLLKAFFHIKKNLNDLRANRKNLQKINAQYLSVTNNKETIKNIISDKAPQFAGFSSLLSTLAEAFKNHPPFSTPKTQYFYSDLYKKVYDSYISK